MNDYLKNINEAIDFIKKKGINNIDIGMILGSGLGKIAEKIQIKIKISYKEIPNFPVSTVKEHSGNLIYGTVGDKHVVFFQGRLHLYEGYSAKEVGFPVRILQKLGGKLLIVSNSAGGVNPGLKKGDIVVIKDHINMMGENPLVGKNIKEFGTRFPIMHDAYNKNLLKKVKVIAKNKNIKLKEGVYLGLKGPSLETDAEYRMVEILGGDMVGMSTVPEVITAVHGGLDVLGFSIITNKFDGMSKNEADFNDVLRVANKAGDVLSNLVLKLIKNLTY
ncbi:MAG: purine-nucleoside phosphorylase [Candidatus Mcinerneyibacterium aminivorans]|uniref:Purine nucleoside phosphorylase n=1 Tax=Candidatus Mcinerneyibacterium aminivorans TaxID=2703815 RepID=A0A5D0MGX8_9BACT|nr:MAG: purine-nucleoside phosphorylase [Candidatus Mcinerneyibacterium aminivorans]